VGFFQYYIPGITNPSVKIDVLKKHGLGGVFESEGFGKGTTTKGPDGGSGLVVSYSNRTGHYKDTQVWQEIHGTKCWIGYDKNDPPTPDDLARDGVTIDGYFVELGDGNKWVVPVARHASGDPNLPRPYKCIDGKWAHGDVVPKYQKLWEVAEKFWEVAKQQFGEDEDSITVPLELNQEIEFALIALSTNYRIDRTEASILQLLNKESVSGILGAVIDWPNVQRLLKKNIEENLAENSSSDPGNAE
jgi:hypothetical protein